VEGGRGAWSRLYLSCGQRRQLRLRLRRMRHGKSIITKWIFT